MFNKNISFAHLTQQQLEKIRQLEDELRNNTDKNIVLLAYDDKDDVRRGSSNTQV